MRHPSRDRSLDATLGPLVIQSRLVERTIGGPYAILRFARRRRVRRSLRLRLRTRRHWFNREGTQSDRLNLVLRRRGETIVRIDTRRHNSFVSVGVRGALGRVIHIPAYRRDWNLAAFRNLQLQQPGSENIVTDLFVEELFPEDRDRPR